MKTHAMKLKPAPFAMIAAGKKTIELRLYDEKRQTIAVGDLIEFENTENSGEVLLARVEELCVFASVLLFGILKILLFSTGLG